MTSPDEMVRYAIEDPHLKSCPARIFAYLAYRLSPTEFRAVKAQALCSSLRLTKPTIRMALRDLIQHGYLMRGRQVDRIYEYRLPDHFPPPARGRVKKLSH